jgi:hypothetical protein
MNNIKSWDTSILYDSILIEYELKLEKMEKKGQIPFGRAEDILQVNS